MKEGDQIKIVKTKRLKRCQLALEAADALMATYTDRSKMSRLHFKMAMRIKKLRNSYHKKLWNEIRKQLPAAWNPEELQMTYHHRAGIVEFREVLKFFKGQDTGTDITDTLSTATDGK